MVTRVGASPTAEKAATTTSRRPAKSAAAEVARKAQKSLARAVAGALGLSGERMSKVDTAWLRMDCEANLMQIVGVWTLQPGLKHAAVRQRIEATLLHYDRFKQRVVQDAAGATWVPDQRFDMANHLVLESLLPAATGNQEAALQQRVAALATERLDPRRPLWQMHLIENYCGADGVPGSALIVRIHHCIADGIALIAVIMSLVDGGAPPIQLADGANAPPQPKDWLEDAVLKPFTQLAVKTLDAMGERAVRALSLLADPKKSMEHSLALGLRGSLDMGRSVLQVLSDSAALALMPDDSKTRLKGKPGGVKKVAWCQPIPLDEVKAVGKALGCSINDVLLSCVAGAIGEYLKAHGDAVAGQEIRAMVPVSLRPQGGEGGHSHQLGNRFGLVPLVLPIGIDNPVERVYEVRRRMALLKGSYQPLLAFSMLAVAGLLAKPAQDLMLNIFSKKTTAVMTNVPGPSNKLTFCGSVLEQAMFWVPQSGDVGLGVSILSYGGGVQFGVITDSSLCPEPRRLIDEFIPALARLSMVTLMLPWSDA